MIDINEYTDYVNSITNANPYPKGGSTGMYIEQIMIKAKNISPTAFKLFMIIAADTNDYGQTNRTRAYLAKAVEIKYNRSRMSRLFSELVEEEFLVLFGKYITVNPYLVMPRVKSPKLKASLQSAWTDLVELV